MAQKKQNRTNKKVANPTANNSMPPKKQSNNTGSEIEKANPHKDKESIPPTDKQDVINDKPKDENMAVAAAERANQLAKFGHIINVIMVFATIALFIITLKTLKQTKRSVDIANESLKDNRESNTANDKRAKEAFDLAKADYENRQIDYEKRQIKDSLNIKLLEQSVIAQSAATEANKTQFNIGNEPFLQASNPVITISDNDVMIYFTLSNYGNYPVKVTKTWIGIATKTVPPPISEIYEKKESIESKGGIYVVKGNTVDVGPHKRHIISANVNLILAKQRRLYVWAYIEYKNLITGKPKSYAFMVGVNPFEADTATFIYNENR